MPARSYITTTNTLPPMTKQTFSRYILVTLLVPFMLLGCSPVQSVDSHAEISWENRRPTTKIPLNIAHRGASFLAPENTLAAYRVAIEVGAEGAEGDVFRSADGVLFLSHDRTPKRTMGGGNEDLTTLTFERIRQFDAGSWKGQQFKGEKVPTLDEYFEFFSGKECSTVLHIKQRGIAADVLECIRKHGRHEIDDMPLIMGNKEIVQEFLRLDSNIHPVLMFSGINLLGNGSSLRGKIVTMLGQKTSEKKCCLR